MPPLAPRSNPGEDAKLAVLQELRVLLRASAAPRQVPGRIHAQPRCFIPRRTGYPSIAQRRKEIGMLDNLKRLLQDPPPAMAFEISEAGIAAARIGARTDMEFQPLKSGTLA